MIIYHLDYTDYASERRKALTQTLDLIITFLDWYDLPTLGHIDGKSLVLVTERDEV